MKAQIQASRTGACVYYRITWFLSPAWGRFLAVADVFYNGCI